MADGPPPIVGWWPPHTWLMAPPYLADDPPILDWWAPPILAWCPPPHGWMMCWVKLVLVLYVWRQDCMRPAQQGLPFIHQVIIRTWVIEWNKPTLLKMNIKTDPPSKVAIHQDYIILTHTTQGVRRFFLENKMRILTKVVKKGKSKITSFLF